MGKKEIEDVDRYVLHPTNKELVDPTWAARVMFALMTTVEHVIVDVDKSPGLAKKAHYVLVQAVCSAISFMAQGKYTVMERNMLIVVLKRAIELDIRYAWNHFGSYGPDTRESSIVIPCTPEVLNALDEVFRKQTIVLTTNRKENDAN